MGRSVIICVSVSHGNTAKVARSLAKVLEADVRGPEEVDPATIPGYDLVGFGAGIFAGRHHPRLREYVEKLPPGGGTPAFVFTTAGTGRSQSWPGQRALDRVLRDKGYDVVGSFACRGFDTWLPLRLVGGINKGHPDRKDLARARARKFAQHVAEQCAAAR